MSSKVGHAMTTDNLHQGVGTTTLLKVEGLKRYFPVTRGIIFQHQVEPIRAVDGVSFEINRAETFGLVGESGCGKSTTARAILRLQEPTSGHVYYDGVDLVGLGTDAMRRMRSKMQMIFQDPYASLNPRMSVAAIIGEPMDVHNIAHGSEKAEKVDYLLEKVGLDPSMANRFPHEFSGGQRQRIGIARALAPEPRLILCDEPISALDVSVQAQVVNLLKSLQKELGLSYLFIAHDLSMVRHISDRVGVMYLGKIVELADRNEVYHHALHPYTQAILSAVPVPDPRVERKRQRIILSGEMPSPSNPPKGCPFHPRCPVKMDMCAVDVPAWRQVSPGHWAACHKI
jgi:oligopeptide transport system ATP-binding protein